MKYVNSLLTFVLLLGLVGCGNHKPAPSVQSNQSTHGVTNYSGDSGQSSAKTNQIDQDTEAQIKLVVKSYITNLVDNNVNQLKKITVDNAKKDLSTDLFDKKAYQSLDQIVSISILPVTGSTGEYSVIAVFEGTLVNQNTASRAQLNMSIQRIKGSYYITSVSRTV